MRWWIWTWWVARVYMLRVRRGGGCEGSIWGVGSIEYGIDVYDQ